MKDRQPTPLQLDAFGPDMSGFRITPLDFAGAAKDAALKYPQVTGAVLAATTAALLDTNPAMAQSIIDELELTKSKLKFTNAAIGGAVGFVWEWVDGKMSKKIHGVMTDGGAAIYRSGADTAELIENTIEGAAVGWLATEVFENKGSMIEGSVKTLFVQALVARIIHTKQKLWFGKFRRHK